MCEDLTVNSLMAVLCTVEPVGLMGVALLRQCRPQPFFLSGVDPAEMAEAAVEIIDHTRACEVSCSGSKTCTPSR